MTLWDSYPLVDKSLPVRMYIVRSCVYGAPLFRAAHKPAQQLAWKVESDLEDGRIENAIKLKSENERESFPAHWDPPPWPGYNHDDPPLLDVIEVIERTPETHVSIRRNPYEYEQLTDVDSSASKKVKQLARDLLKTAKVEPDEE